MRRTVFIVSAIGVLMSPLAAFAQLSGGPGNFGGGASAGPPTIEDYIDVAHKEIDKAVADKTISVHKAKSAERKLKVIEHKLDHLGREVSEIRRSLQ